MFDIGSFIGIQDRYQIKKIIGKGGMGTVLKAYDTILKEDVAIKTLNKNLALDEKIKNRFLNEAKICLTLNHPNIIRVRDVNIHDDTYYMVMEYIDGIELKELITQQKDKTPNDPEYIYPLIKPILEALSYAHKYTIHRDIKPSNIMIKDNIAYLMDFGISKALENSELENETIIGGMGTKKYISPEQAFNANDVDKRADIYSMGILFYELITNHRPQNTSFKDPLNPSLFNDQISSKLAYIILKMIKAKPNERYNNFNEVIEELDFVILNENNTYFDNKIEKEQKEDTTLPLIKNLDNMVFVKKGNFLRGSGIESNIESEKPRKNIYLDDFYICIYPVTNHEYNKFLNSQKYKRPKDFDNLFIKYPMHPVVNVSYKDALEYCNYAKVSLPTEAQWEKAAKGNKNFNYPWGNEYKVNHANIAHLSKTTSDVRAFKNSINPLGIYQMAGNIWEWCLDDFENDFYKKSPTSNPVNKTNTNQKVLRGGSFDFVNNAARNSFRFSANMNLFENNIGFRVVRNIV